MIEATSHLGGLTFLLTCNCNSMDLNIKELPLFYERMLQYCFESGFEFKDLQSDKTLYTKKTTIWNNQDIKIDNKTIFFRTWFDKGVHTVKDLVDQNLDFLTYDEFQLRYHLQTNFLTYYGLINAIPREYKKSNKTNRCTARTSYTTMGELKSVNSQSHS